MELKKILKRRREARLLLGSRSSFKSKRLRGFAEKCWYGLVKSGSDPRYEHTILEDEPPLFIPYHSVEVNQNTGKSLLLQIDGALFRLEEEARKREGKSHGDD